MKIITCIMLFFCLHHTLLYTAAQQADHAPSTVITSRSSVAVNIPPQLHPQPQPQARHRQSCWQRTKKPFLLLGIYLLAGTAGGFFGNYLSSLPCDKELEKLSALCATPTTDMTDSCWSLIAFKCPGYVTGSDVWCPSNTTVTIDSLLESTQAQQFKKKNPDTRVCVVARDCRFFPCHK